MDETAVTDEMVETAVICEIDETVETGVTVKKLRLQGDLLIPCYC